MVLISIQPFALRKLFLVIAALLCFSALCFADPVLMAQRYTAPGLKACPELQRVDLPARTQEFLLGKSPHAEPPPVLVISARIAYT
jgi:hypothetical protein